jgi:hypothetical protein
MHGFRRSNDEPLDYDELIVVVCDGVELDPGRDRRCSQAGATVIATRNSERRGGQHCAHEAASHAAAACRLPANRSTADRATASRAPCSSKRWVAPGTTTTTRRWRQGVMWAAARRLRSSTARSFAIPEADGHEVGRRRETHDVVGNAAKGADGELWLARVPDLANHEHVEGRSQPGGELSPSVMALGE